MSWKFEFITEYDKCFGEEILKFWKRLQSDHVFNDHRLIKVWTDSYKAVNALSLLWVKGQHSDGNQSLWPLVIIRKGWRDAYKRVITPAGGGDYDYHSPMFLNKPNLAEYYNDLIASLRQIGGFDEILLSEIPDDLTPFSFGKWQIEAECPRLDLSDIANEDALMKFFKTSFRGDLRRQLRRLNEIGEVRLVEYRNWAEAAQEFGTFIEVHSKQWPQAVKTPNFHRFLLSDGLIDDIVSFTALKVGDKTAAWHLGFKDSERFYYYMPARNEEFIQYSPGKILLWMLVNKAINGNLKIYDLMRGSEGYKNDWSNSSQNVNMLCIDVHGIIPSTKRNMIRLKEATKYCRRKIKRFIKK